MNVQSLCNSCQDWSHWIEPRRAGDCIIGVSWTSCSSTSSLYKDWVMQKVHARPDLRPSMSSTDGRSRDGVCRLQQLLAVVVIVVIIFRASVSSVSCHYRSFIIVITTGLFWSGVDSFHFRAVWMLSTRLLSVCCSGATWILSARVSLSSS